MDEYSESAEYLHLLSLPAWEALRPRVAAALAAAPGDGTIVELGAGTGLGTAVVLAAVPRVPVVVAEPSAPLRAVLLARLHDHPDGDRVSVHPGPAQQLPLPDRISAVLGAHMIGHLSPPERHALFTAVAARLLPGAPVLLTAQPPEVATTVPEWPPFGVTQGGVTYEVAGGATPTGPDSVRWRMRYATRRGDTVLHRTTVEYDWWVHSPDRLVDELAAAGLPDARAEGDLVVARR